MSIRCQLVNRRARKTDKAEFFLFRRHSRSFGFRDPRVASSSMCLAGSYAVCVCDVEVASPSPCLHLPGVNVVSVQGLRARSQLRIAKP
jgi:hypothetical protein